MPYPGEILAGIYQITDEIGMGGAGVIYRAYHRNLQKYVVVKKMKDNFVGVLNARGEVDILKSLHHTSLPQVYDFIQIGTQVYTVMDYIEGYDLKYYIDQGYFFPEETLWTWLQQLCDVLAYLHSHGILHLDIKPANIMLTAEGNICLIDFNISLSEDVEEMAGISQVYASPEQYRKWRGVLYHTQDGRISLDGRTDIYSLGASFYHMMTHCMPSPDPAYLQPMSSMNLPYSQTLITLVERMMRPDPKNRYADAGKILTAMHRMKRTKEEKYTLRIVFAGMLLAVILLGMTFGIYVYRIRSSAENKAQKMVEREELLLADLNETGAYQEAYQEGIYFLGQQKEMLDRLEGARESIAEKLLEACIGMEDYDMAQQYVTELLESGEDPVWYEQAAVIAAYQGEFSKAEEYLTRAQQTGGSGEELNISRAEICAAKGDYDEAIAAYHSMYEKSQKTEFLRKQAYLNLRAGLQEGIAAAEASVYFENAMVQYEKLLKMKAASYEDHMHLVRVYTECQYPEQAVSLLRGMCADYPGRYEIYRDLASLEVAAEMKKAPAQRDFTRAKADSRQAEKLYRTENRKNQDEELEELVELTETLP